MSTAGPLGKDLAPEFELTCVDGIGAVESDVVVVPPMELSKGAPLQGTGCAVSGSASGAVTLDCSKMQLAGHIETQDAAADIRISGRFVAEGSVADGKLVDASLFPAGGARQVWG